MGKDSEHSITEIDEAGNFEFILPALSDGFTGPFHLHAIETPAAGATSSLYAHTFDLPMCSSLDLGNIFLPRIYDPQGLNMLSEGWHEVDDGSFSMRLDPARIDARTAGSTAFGAVRVPDTLLPYQFVGDDERVVAAWAFAPHSATVEDGAPHSACESTKVSV